VSRNSADLNDLICPFYNPSARAAQKIIVLLLLREFVSEETRLPNHSTASAACVTFRTVTVAPVLRAGITQQCLFLGLHTCFEQMRHIM
jgi:hypothetical protein